MPRNRRTNNKNTRSVKHDKSVQQEKFYFHSNRIDLDHQSIQTMNPLIAPDRARVKLKYIQTVTMNSYLGALDTQEFWGNGAYDPDKTGTGTQPTGFDQWAALYDKYTVIASSIKVRLVDLQGSGGDTESLLLAILPCTETSFAPTDINEIAALPYGKFGQIYPQSDGNPGAPSNTLTNYISTAKIFGTYDDAVKYERNYSSAINASPNQGWYWMVYMQSADGTTSNQPDVYFLITYHIEFWDRITLTPSLLSYGMRQMRALYDSLLEQQMERRRQAICNFQETGFSSECDCPTCLLNNGRKTTPSGSMIPDNQIHTQLGVECARLQIAPIASSCPRAASQQGVVRDGE
jgi:hypothetical protein